MILRQLVTDLATGAFLAYGAGTDVQQVTFDELVSTGRLQLLRDTSLRTALISYYGAIEVQKVRVIARQTRSAPRVYELVPNESEFVPRTGLTLAQLLVIADKVTDGTVEELATAELNRGLERKEIVQELAPRAESLLALIDSQLENFE